uniref:Uncharacterized protein n=1 Tax=Musa acuminata subsp. malaccensis TaxID=214687 RepID=A0A804LAS7_MUSAM
MLPRTQGCGGGRRERRAASHGYEVFSMMVACGSRVRRFL